MNCLLLISLLCVCYYSNGQKYYSETSEFFERIAKGATCMYKIQKEYQICHELQQDRLKEESKKIKVMTYKEQEYELNKVGCCSFWQFLDCIQKAVQDKCQEKEWWEVKKYTEQLGSAVPVKTCYSDFPRSSCSFPTWAIAGIAIAAIIILFFIVLIIIICTRK